MQRPDDLDDLFAEARERAAMPSDMLMQRVLADALAVQPVPRGAVARGGGRRGGILSWLASLFGGFGALAGMGTAAVAGLAIGYVQPVALGLVGDAVLGAPVETVDLVPDVGMLLAGGE